MVKIHWQSGKASLCDKYSQHCQRRHANSHCEETEMYEIIINDVNRCIVIALLISLLIFESFKINHMISKRSFKIYYIARLMAQKNLVLLGSISSSHEAKRNIREIEVSHVNLSFIILFRLLYRCSIRSLAIFIIQNSINSTKSNSC